MLRSRSARSLLTSRKSASRHPLHQAVAAQLQPLPEALESRRLFATFTVTSTADTLTAGTLRQAITDANADADASSIINFNISGSGLQTINVGSSGLGALPALTHPVTINGYSQTGTSANTKADGDDAKLFIELSGASAGAGANGLTLAAGSGGSTVSGLVINRFSNDGILVESNGNTVSGNFVGTNFTGLAPFSNGQDGIRINGASNNIIGGTAPADRNIASGNQFDGIHVVVDAGPSTGNLIQGNFVGVNSTGNGSVGIKAFGPAAGTPAGNFVFGIEISGGNNNTVGGAVTGARNVVGFNAAGIEVDDGGQANVIQGNYSGVGADGVSQVGNVLHGIVLRSDGTLSAPLGPGQTNEPAVANNIVGLNPTDFSGLGNVVAYNGTAGIAVFGNPLPNNATPAQNAGNSILGNSFYQNGRNSPTTLLGIDLTNQLVFPGDDGVTANDAGKNIAGTAAAHSDASDPNNFQNKPVLSAVTATATGVKIDGSLTQSVSPNTKYRIEFYSNNADPKGGVAEGETFLGATDVTTDSTGKATFSATFTTAVGAGDTFTATATNLTADPSSPTGSANLYNTSEFSDAATVAAPAAYPLLTGNLPATIITGQSLKLKEKVGFTATTAPVTGTETANVVFSTDDTADANDFSLGSTTANLKLKAGQTKAFALKTPSSIPSSVAAGTYKVLIKVTDASGAVTTVDTGNTVTIVAPKLDLTGRFISAVAANGKVTTTFLITNSADSNITADGTVPYTFQSNSTASSTGATTLLTGSAKVKKLAPGQSITVTVTTNLSASSFLVVTLDPDHSAFPADTNTANNTFATATLITLEGPLPG